MVTEYICWDCEKGYQPQDLQRAAMVLKQHGLVAFPTETVYGLGGSGLCPEAAKRIYEAKGRPSDNPLILHISKSEQLPMIADRIPDVAYSLMKAFWPGPMTLIFHKNKCVPREITGGLETVAVRMPSHEAARMLIEAAGVPIAAPSANTSGRPSPTTAAHVREDLDGRIEMIIDGGAVNIGVESTIVDLTEDIPTILRPGHITKDMLQQVAGEVRMDAGLLGTDSDRKPKAPGMKYRHYAPRAKMTVFDGELDVVVKQINDRAREYPAAQVGILASEETADSYTHGQVVSAGSRNAGTIEQGLYSALRLFDHKGVEVILSESFSQEDKGEAIMNRLMKAAGQHIIYLSRE